MKFVLNLISKVVRSEGVSYLGLGVIAVIIVGAILRINAVKLEQAETHVKMLQEEIRGHWEIQIKYAKIVDTLQDQLARANSLARARVADIERLRNANAKLQAKLAASPTEPNAEALARCSQLLSEGAGLAAEGEGLLLTHGITHDALVELKKQ